MHPLAQFRLLPYPVAVIGLLLPLLTAHAQTTSTKAPATPPEEAVVLSAFEVKAEPDTSYGAVNSNSITAFSTELNRLPVNAEVFNEAFMNDVGATTVEQMLQNFAAGAGTASINTDSSAGNSQYLDRNANGSLSIRGLAAPTYQVNGFFPSGGGGTTGTGLSTTYSTERIEVISGPQALLYGVSGAGGVINAVTKQARFNKRSFGSFKYQVDQYGNKLGLFDYGWGGARFAVRVAATDQYIGGRRVDIGGPLKGAYVQVAAGLFRQTVLRLSVDKTAFNRLNAGGSNNLALTALSTANDARNGQALKWLLATNQVAAAANGAASGAGNIMNGTLNWNNIDSIGGVYSGENQNHTLSTLVAESRWSSWLSTQVGVGLRTEDRKKIGNSAVAFDAPNVAANPTGTWAVTMGGSAATYLSEPLRQKVVRCSALASNELWGGRIRSQTVVGTDFSRTDGAVNSFEFVLADSSFNPVLTGLTTNNGYTIMPTVYWPVARGPVKQPYWAGDAGQVTYLGKNYVRVVTNDTNSALISPTNPEGLTGTGTGDFRHTSDIESGIYGANYSDWLDGRLSTLAGFRAGKSYTRSATEASAPNPPSVLSIASASYIAFNGGANYRLNRWLRAYGEVSDSYNPPGVQGADPYGNFQKTANAIGEEVGLKVASPDTKLSGSLAIYHTVSKNELYQFTSTLTTDINPAGINGQAGPANNIVNVDRQSQGAQISVTAVPTDGWRLRFSGATVQGTISSNVSYKQLYNDQFYANSQGQVTYKDGTVVYVLPTSTVGTTSATAGAVPLTLALMNDSTSRFYANPGLINAAIGSNSVVAGILKNTSDPIHGPIKTGVTGLPISALQIAPNPLSPPPGELVIARAGDAVTGFPRFSFNVTSVYTIRGGAFKGVRLGGTLVSSWKNSLFYYYANGLSSPNAGRTMFYLPNQQIFGGILGYDRKYQGFTFSTQLNINNMFNRYHVVLLPNSITGWAGPNNATFDQQPQSFVWSSTFSF